MCVCFFFSPNVGLESLYQFYCSSLRALYRERLFRDFVHFVATDTSANNHASIEVRSDSFLPSLHKYASCPTITTITNSTPLLVVVVDAHERHSPCTPSQRVELLSWSPRLFGILGFTGPLVVGLDAHVCFPSSSPSSSSFFFFFFTHSDSISSGGLVLFALGFAIVL